MRAFVSAGAALALWCGPFCVARAEKPPVMMQCHGSTTRSAESILAARTADQSGVHVIVTSPTLAEAIVPCPPATTQVSPAGCW